MICHSWDIYGRYLSKATKGRVRKWFAIQTWLGRWLDRRWGKFLNRRIAIHSSQLDQAVFDAEVERDKAIERSERKRIQAKYAQPAMTSTAILPDPIPESATASPYELCRQSGVLSFWDDEPDLYLESKD